MVIALDVYGAIRLFGSGRPTIGAVKSGMNSATLARPDESGRVPAWI